MNPRRIPWTLMCGLLALGGYPAAAQDLGDGRGIDHVAALVRSENFDAVGDVFTDQLGFSVTPALLSPLVADFAAERGEGILGVSLEVGDLDTAHALITGNTGLDLPVFKHKGQERFLIPVSLTHGFLIEMIE